MPRFFLLALLAFLFVACQSNPQTPTATTTTTPSASPEAFEAYPAPQVIAKNSEAADVDFSKLYADSIVLVYFYPKADTPGCTAQACSLRDAYESLTDKGITVVGVSTDTSVDQKAFKAKYQLPFTLIADTEQEVVKAFGVRDAGGMAGREAFLIKEGKVLWHDSSASTAEQAKDVLAQIESWKDG